MSPAPHRRRHRRPAVIAAALAIAAPALALGGPAASAASAASSPTSPGALAKGLANCPINNPAVTECLYSVTTSGNFTIGGTSLSLTAPIKVTLGLIPLGGSDFAAVGPTNGTPELSTVPLEVPGGILGIPGSSGPLAVTALPQLVGQPTFNLFNLETLKTPAFTLPLDVLLGNPLLGSSCTIGSPSSPINLNLTDGTTAPPAPNTPIQGALGKLKSNQKTGSLTDTGLSLVDNSFAVGGAAGCGPLGLGLFDPLVDAIKGLPSAAGKNQAILDGSAILESAAAVRG